LVAQGVRKHFGLGLVIFVGADIGLHLRAARALDQHLHGAVGQLQELEHVRQRADLVDRIGGRIVVRRIDLRRQQDVTVVLDHFLKRADRLFATDEKRDDHVREDDNVAQRQNRVGSGRAWNNRLTWLRLCHETTSL